MIVDYFDKVYTNIKGRSKIASLKRFLTRIVSNLVIPINFMITKKHRIKYQSKNDFEKKIIVSLTSFPARINRIWLVIECILRQSMRPDLIILYLAESQFPNRERGLPKKVLKYLDNKQLEIKFVEDLRSHKKYFYSFQEFADDLVILVDDDIFYPSNTIENLLIEYKKHPDCIICSRANNVKKEKGKILPYEKWEKLKTFKGPSFSVFHTSGGGTLYSPGRFTSDLYDKNVFLTYCKYADDVWLNLQAQRSKLQTVKTGRYSEILPILNFNTYALKNINVASGGNDEQLKKLIDFYKIDENEVFNYRLRLKE